MKGDNNYIPQIGEICWISGHNCDDENGYVWSKLKVLWLDDTFILYRANNCWPVLTKLELVAIRKLEFSWISVEEFLPEIGETILSYSDVDRRIRQTEYVTYGKESVGYAEGKRDCWFEYIDKNYANHHEANYWMPLPELPTIKDT